MTRSHLQIGSMTRPSPGSDCREGLSSLRYFQLDDPGEACPCVCLWRPTCHEAREPNRIQNSYSHYPTKEISDTSIVDHAFITIDYDNGSKANLGLCMYLKPRNLMGEGLEIGLIGENGGQMVARNDKTIDIVGGQDWTKDHLDIDVSSDSIMGGHTGADPAH